MYEMRSAAHRLHNLRGAIPGSINLLLLSLIRHLYKIFRRTISFRSVYLLIQLEGIGRREAGRCIVEDARQSRSAMSAN